MKEREYFLKRQFIYIHKGEISNERIEGFTKSKEYCPK